MSLILFSSLAALTGSYLIGSIPIGLLLVWVATHKDVREVGSGRIGGTNTLRAAGPWVALVTILCDIGKGFFPVILTRAILSAQGVVSPLVEALAGVMAVVGHNYSVFIGFKGGAGTMTSGGGALGLWPWIFFCLAPPGIGMVFLTGHASVGSITVAVLMPMVYLVRALAGAGPWEHLIHGLATSALTLWSLRPNIQRLIDGRERQVVIQTPAPATVASQQPDVDSNKSSR
jgi:glycerol-3-phosphate acyltransferase PlsY